MAAHDLNLQVTHQFNDTKKMKWHSINNLKKFTQNLDYSTSWKLKVIWAYSKNLSNGHMNMEGLFT